MRRNALRWIGHVLFMARNHLVTEPPFNGSVPLEQSAHTVAHDLAYGRIGPRFDLFLDDLGHVERERNAELPRGSRVPVLDFKYYSRE
jgi:hypothetical protein